MTEPKPRIEVQQESTERLEVLELDRTPRPEKLARETAFLEGASEVAFRERAFRPRHPATVDEVRAYVDALVVERRALPDVPAPPELPPAPAPPPRPIDARYVRLLAPVLPAPLVAVEPVFASEAGEVVEAYWDEDGQRRSREFLLKDDVATPVEDVSSRVDALPAPKLTAPPPPPAPAPAPAEESKAKRKLGLPSFGKKKEGAPEPKAEPPAPEPAKEKRKLGLPSFGKKKEAPQEAAPAEAAPDAKAAEESGEKKRRFGFGKR